MIGDIRLRAEEHGVAGDVYVLDAAVATPTHFAKFTPALVKKFLVCAMEAYPVKVKEVHVINVSPLVDTILNFVKPFLKEKIRNRIFMHSDIKSLYEYVPQEILPTEYGGDAGPIQDIHGTTFLYFIDSELQSASRTVAFNFMHIFLESLDNFRINFSIKNSPKKVLKKRH